MQLESTTRLIRLRHGEVTIVDAADYDALVPFEWHAEKAPKSRTLYAVRDIRVDGRVIRLRMHRLILNAQPGEKVDHRDMNGLNNVRANLRLATHPQNGRNRGAQLNNTSGFKGVSYVSDASAKHPWLAKINTDGHPLYLGLFGTPEAAARAYDVAARRMHGEFARLNFPATHPEASPVLDTPHFHPCHPYREDRDHPSECPCFDSEDIPERQHQGYGQSCAAFKRKTGKYHRCHERPRIWKSRRKS